MEKEAADSLENKEKICKDLLKKWDVQTKDNISKKYDLSGVPPEGEGKDKTKPPRGIHETDISSLSSRITFLSTDYKNFKKIVQEALEKIPEAVTPIIIEKLAEQQNEASAQQQIYKNTLSTAILISGFATVVSAALSSYLFSIGSLAGVAFFYPTIIGLGTILFLLYKNYRRGHIK